MDFDSEKNLLSQLCLIDEYSEQDLFSLIQEGLDINSQPFLWALSRCLYHVSYWRPRLSERLASFAKFVLDSIENKKEFIDALHVFLVSRESEDSYIIACPDQAYFYGLLDKYGAVDITYALLEVADSPYDYDGIAPLVFICEKKLQGSFQRLTKIIQSQYDDNGLREIIISDNPEDLQRLSPDGSLLKREYHYTNIEELESVNAADISAFYGSPSCFKYCLMNEVGITSKTGGFAVSGGNYAIIHQLVEMEMIGLDDIKNAVKHGHNEVALWLIEQFALEESSNPESHFNLELMEEACFTNNLEFIEHLISLGVKPTIDHFKYAAMYDNLNIIRALEKCLELSEEEKEEVIQSATEEKSGDVLRYYGIE